jgi:hypothetical protein
MRQEAAGEMDGNKRHYANILKALADSTGVRLPEVTRTLGV